MFLFMFLFNVMLLYQKEMCTARYFEDNKYPLTLQDNLNPTYYQNVNQESEETNENKLKRRLFQQQTGVNTEEQRMNDYSRTLNTPFVGISNGYQNLLPQPEFIAQPFSSIKNKYSPTSLQSYNSYVHEYMRTLEDMFENRKEEPSFHTTDEKLYKRVLNESETVVEIIGDDTANYTTDHSSFQTLSTVDGTNETSNETQEFQELLNEARKTKEQIEQLTAKLNEDSDEPSLSQQNDTNASKKSTDTENDKLVDDISVERGVRKLLVKHLIQVQIESKHREEALESMLRHFPVENKVLRTWNITEGGLKEILKAKIILLGPENRLKLAKKINSLKETEN